MKRCVEVIDNTGKGKGRFWVVDQNGEAELGTWFIAATYWRRDAEFIAAAYNLTNGPARNLETGGA